MDIDFYSQSIAFLCSILLGIALGILYGPFKAVRLALFTSRVSVIISDVIFMLICTFSIFFFSLAMLYGCIRFYVIFGALGGFLLYRNTLGRLTAAIYTPIIAFLKKAACKIRRIFKKIAKNLLKISSKILYNINILKNKIISLSENKRVMANNEKGRNKKS